MLVQIVLSKGVRQYNIYINTIVPAYDFTFMDFNFLTFYSS